MHPLQIVIKKDSYEIYDQEVSKSLVSDIPSFEEAMVIFRELISSTIHPPEKIAEARSDWFMVPGVLRPN
ncbi:MAG: hypothetical protein HQL71_08595 [Magnetococcales bacterium]|nr:hypothetical protein [Magnetococcales bacterium]